ncbi:MAG: hypothetical protein JWO71_657, partial [Candidatus Acidoferrum typicum]|nr:hypothetical protein [Candidatus Acidoferrum typicum]
MPVEIIGEAGTAGASREWIDAECQLAIKRLIKVCGEPPPEMKLEVQWQEACRECSLSATRAAAPSSASRRQWERAPLRSSLSTSTCAQHDP